MPTATATVPTLQASRYLQQLCKHWSHKFATDFDPRRGTVHLPAADLSLDAADDALWLQLSGADASALPRLCDVVADHVRRFAFREDLVFEWTQAPA